MKKTIFSLIAWASFISLTTAQESYTIKSSMKMEGLPPEYSGFGDMEMVTYLKGDKYKRETNSMMASAIGRINPLSAPTVTKIFTGLPINM